MFKYLCRRGFVMRGDVKVVSAKCVIDYSHPKEFMTVIDSNVSLTNIIKSEEPLEALLQTLNMCKLRTLSYYVSSNKLTPYINSMSMTSNAEFDLKRFYGKVNEPIRYTFLNIDINIELNKEKNLNDITTKEKLSENIEAFGHRCPVYGMLLPAQIPTNLKINYI